jgi:Flp pilus assembly protein TadB
MVFPFQNRQERKRGIQRAPVEIILASWCDRFLAWLVDFILVSIGLAILFALISIPFWFSYSYGSM